MTKIVLTDLANLQNETTATSAINANNAILEAALDNTLSRDGTSPNTMSSSLDMNGSQILNLPSPGSVYSPVRLVDVTTSPIISSVPPTGTSGAVVGFLNGNNTYSGTSAFTGVATLTNPVINNATNATLVTPNLGTPSTIILTNGTGLPLTAVAGLGANVATFLATPSSSNLAAAVTGETGTGNLVFSNSPTLVTPTLGVASATSINSTGTIKSSSPTAGVGYAAGAGAAVTQITSRTTGVTISTPTGAITLFSAAGSATASTFIVTNSSVDATDVIHVSQRSGTNLYNILVTAVASGSFNITQYTTGGTTVEAPVFNFTVIKGVNS